MRPAEIMVDDAGKHRYIRSGEIPVNGDGVPFLVNGLSRLLHLPEYDNEHPHEGQIWCQDGKLWIFLNGERWEIGVSMPVESSSSLLSSSSSGKPSSSSSSSSSSSLISSLLSSLSSVLSSMSSSVIASSLSSSSRSSSSQYSSLSSVLSSLSSEQQSSLLSSLSSEQQSSLLSSLSSGQQSSLSSEQSSSMSPGSSKQSSSSERSSASSSSSYQEESVCDDKIKLLLHFDGTDGSSDIFDSSPSQHPVTVNGVTISASAGKFGESGSFASGRELRVPDSVDWDFGTGSWTVDFWIRPTATSNYSGIVGITSYNQSGWSIMLDSNTNRVRLMLNYSQIIVASTALQLNQWTHVEVVKDAVGGTVSIYLNGKLDVQAADDKSYDGNPGDDLLIGRLYNDYNNFYLTGYLDELCISKGVARHTSDFDPPSIPYCEGISFSSAESSQAPSSSSSSLTQESSSSSPSSSQQSSLSSVIGLCDDYTKLLLHMDETPFKDSSGNNHIVNAYAGAQVDTTQKKFGSGSGLFNGDTDSLIVENSDDWNFGANPFTIDCWVRFNSLIDRSTIITTRHDGNDPNNWWSLIKHENGDIIFEAKANGSTIAYYSYTPSFSIGVWYHLALVRDGTSIKIFENGIEKVLTVTTAIGNNAVPPASDYLYIADYGNHDGNEGMNGWIDELRISKGIARWLSNFTPPAYPYCTEISSISSSSSVEPKQCDAYTEMLLPFDGDISDFTGKHTPTPIGSGLSFVQGKFGQALQTNGSNGVSITDPEFASGNGDFTIDFWLYIGSTDIYPKKVLLDKPGDWSLSISTTLGSYDVDLIFYDVDGDNTLQETFGTHVQVGGPANKWHYITVMREGSNIAIGFDGDMRFSYFSLSNYTGNTLKIAGDSTYAYALDDFRYSNIARWDVSGNYGFAPPTCAHCEEPVSDENVVLLLHCDIEYDGDYYPYGTYEQYNIETLIDSSIYRHISMSSEILLVASDKKFGTHSSSAIWSLKGGGGRAAIGGKKFKLFNYDFTAECWFKPIVNGTYGLMGRWDNDSTGTYYSWVLRVVNGKLSASVTPTGSLSAAVTLTGGTTVSLRNWHHAAFVRKNDTLYLFLDGILQASTSYSDIINPIDNLTVGGYYEEPGIQSSVPGLYDEVCLTLKTGKWTSNFVPPSEPYYGGKPYQEESSSSSAGQNDKDRLLVMHFTGRDNADVFTDNSDFKTLMYKSGAPVIKTAEHVYDNSSIYFNGSSYIYTPYDSRFDFKDNDFTISLWEFTDSGNVAANALLYLEQSYGNTAYSITARTNGAGNTWYCHAQFYSNDYDIYFTLSVLNRTSDVWHHIEVCRSGDEFYMFVDGTVVSATIADFVLKNIGGGNFWLGGNSDGSKRKGYVDELAMIKGKALHTSNFTPSRQLPGPESNDHYCQLLLHCDADPFIDSSYKQNTVTKVGSPLLSTNAKFGKSLYTYNDTNYLTVPQSSDWQLGAGDYTIDWWWRRSANYCYPFGLDDGNNIMWCGITISSSSGGTITGQVFIYSMDMGASTYAVNCTFDFSIPDTDVWTHVAICRSDGVTSAYMDGVTLTPNTTQEGTFLAVNSPLLVGRYGAYLDELRWSKGIVRWWGDFNPPTAPYAEPPAL